MECEIDRCHGAIVWHILRAINSRRQRYIYSFRYSLFPLQTKLRTENQRRKYIC